MTVTRLAAALALTLAACQTVESDPGPDLGDAGDGDAGMCDLSTENFGAPPDLSADEQAECEAIVVRTPSVDDVADAIADACGDSPNPGACAMETASSYPYDCSGSTEGCTEDIGKVLSFIGIDAAECLESGAAFPEDCRWCRAEERILGNEWRCGGQPTSAG